ncbi:hypothetical protein BDZ89DRAFT_1115727 [Hymenopellis radicata]|nr:hypothetical protein BDZ89DRAFT_1115727 [Hymenopellis radicata]
MNRRTVALLMGQWIQATHIPVTGSTATMGKKRTRLKTDKRVYSDDGGKEHGAQEAPYGSTRLVMDAPGGLKYVHKERSRIRHTDSTNHHHSEGQLSIYEYTPSKKCNPALASTHTSVLPKADVGLLIKLILLLCRCSSQTQQTRGIHRALQCDCLLPAALQQSANSFHPPDRPGWRSTTVLAGI